jgi:hypothetical protein
LITQKSISTVCLLRQFVAGTWDGRPFCHIAMRAGCGDLIPEWLRQQWDGY